MTFRLLLATVLALVAASPATAATVLLSDDAEGAVEDKWVAAAPTNPLLEPWQKSDSSAPKFRGNQANGGATSYWAGPTPEGMHPADVVEGEILLTSKTPILIPADGKTTVSFFSLFQNEGDDSGTFEAALASNTTAKGAWKKVAAVKLETSEVTNPEYVPGYCTAKPGATTQGFEELKGDFSAFAGKLVFVRFNMKYGSENRASSFPCGWYVDDIKIETTGTPGNAGATVPPVTPPASGTGPAAAKSTVKLASLKGKGKKASVRMTVEGGAIGNVVMTLFQGKKKLHEFRAKGIPAGTRTITFKTRKKLRKGALTLKLAALGADGGRVSAMTKGKAR